MKTILNVLRKISPNIIQGLLHQIALIILAIFISSILLLLTGYNPLAVYKGIVIGAVADFPGTLRWVTPLILAGLAASAAFSAGLVNLGIDGQLYLGGITAAIIGLKLANLPMPLSILIAGIAGMLIGMLWALLPGLLRAQWGTSEVVTTLLLNFVAFFITDYLVLGSFRGTGSSAGTFSTNTLTKNFWLPRIIQDSQVNIGLIISIVLAFILLYLFRKTTVGYEFKIIGKNALFAKYGGLNVKRTILISMAFSGAIAGLVGVEEILGVHHRFPGRFSSGLGFDGVVVALLANNNPVGILLSGLFFGALRNGAMNMERVTNVPRAMVDIVQSIIVLMVTIKFFINSNHKKKKDQNPSEQKSNISDSLTKH
ncbi:MAG: ABC transporter permease [Anaerolineaceae bacterium]